MSSPRSHTKGFTLIEVLIALLVVSFSLLAVVGALSASSIQSTRSLVMLQCEQLAHAYLADALALPYADVTAPIGKELVTRNLYDDVADYNGDVYAAITDRANGAVANFPGFTAGFTVTNTLVGPANNVPAFEVVVTVNSPDGRCAVASGLRTNTP